MMAAQFNFAPFGFFEEIVEGPFPQAILRPPRNPARNVAQDRIDMDNQEERRISQEIEKYSIQDDKYDNIKEIKEKNLMCPICFGVITGTVAITSCTHKYCSRCLHKHVRSSLSPNCPMCRKELSPSDISLSEEETEYLDSSIVECRNAECKEKMMRKEYNSHIDNCKYNKAKCDDCLTLIYLKDSDQHKSVCAFRNVECNLCKATVKYNKSEEHREKLCPHMPIKCPNEKCRYEASRHKIPNHLTQCKFRSIVCRNGCGLKFELQNESKHNESCVMRIISCEWCKIKLQEKNLHTHCDVCPKKPIECMYCNEKITLEVNVTHSQVCTERVMKCDCGLEIIRKDMAEHKKRCSCCLKVCGVCDTHIPEKDMENHQKVCPKKIVQCQNCGNEHFLMNMNAHNATCEYAKVICKYHYAGCSDEFVRKETKQHMDDNVTQHLALLDAYVEEFVHNSKSQIEGEQIVEVEDIDSDDSE